MKKWLILAYLPALFFACTPNADSPVPESFSIEGLKPIYINETEAQVVMALPPQPILRLGKIYYKDATIYVNEGNLGVHIIDNTDPVNPVKKKFLQIPGCRDIAIKGNFLYADNNGDLVAIDISDIENPVVTKRLPGVQPSTNPRFPELYEGYFDCVEEGKGVVIGWEKAVLTDPKCWR